MFPSPSKAPFLCAERGDRTHINVAVVMSKALNAKFGMAFYCPTGGERHRRVPGSRRGGTVRSRMVTQRSASFNPLR